LISHGPYHPDQDLHSPALFSDRRHIKLDKTGGLSGALELLQPAVERFPYHIGLRFSLAGAQRKLGKFKEAEEEFQRAAALDPNLKAPQLNEH